MPSFETNSQPARYDQHVLVSARSDHLVQTITFVSARSYLHVHNCSFFGSTRSLSRAMNMLRLVAMCGRSVWSLRLVAPFGRSFCACRSPDSVEAMLERINNNCAAAIVPLANVIARHSLERQTKALVFIIPPPNRQTFTSSTHQQQQYSHLF